MDTAEAITKLVADGVITQDADGVIRMTPETFRRMLTIDPAAQAARNPSTSRSSPRRRRMSGDD